MGLIELAFNSAGDHIERMVNEDLGHLLSLEHDRRGSGGELHGAALAALRELRPAERRCLGEALGIICRTLDTPIAKILELSGDGKQLLLRAGIGWNEGIVLGAVVPATNKSTAGYALGFRGSVIFDDVQRTRRFADSTLLRSHKVTSSLAVRLEARMRVIGVLSVHELRPRRFTSREAGFLEEAALTVAELLRQLEQ
jgi:GAF domain-containing protein